MSGCPGFQIRANMWVSWIPPGGTVIRSGEFIRRDAPANAGFSPCHGGIPCGLGISSATEIAAPRGGNLGGWLIRHDIEPIETSKVFRVSGNEG